MSKRHRQLDRIESLIAFDDDGSGNLARVEQFAVKPGAKVRPLWKLGRPKLDADDRLHFSWFKTFCDPFDWHFTAADGVPYQKLTERVEEHLNTRAADWRSGKRLARMKAYQLGKCRRGQTSPVHVRPRRCRQNQFIAVRLDFDAHQGQADAQAACNWLTTEHFAGSLYDEPSTNGWSAWIVIDFGPIGEREGESIYPSKVKINRLMGELQTALRALLTAQGFTSTIEVCGRFTIPRKLDDGSITIPAGSRGQPFKMPRCVNAGDAAKLHASRFDESIIHQIIAASGAAKPQATARAATPRRIDKALTTFSAIQASDDKHRNRCRCVRRALKMLFGHPHSWPNELTAEQIAQVIESANSIYEASGMASGPRDAARVTKFNQIIRWMLSTGSTYQGSDGAGDQIWFDMPDLKRADDILRSLLSAARLDELNDQHKRQFDGATINYFLLALVLCTMTKNAVVRGGQVPSESIAGMLAHFGLRHNRSIVAEAMKFIRELGLASYTHNGSYRPGRWCRSYQPSAQAWSLPFVVHLKPQEHDQHIAQEQAARYTASGPGLTTSIIIHDNTNSHCISMKAATSIASDECCSTDTEFWSSLEVFAQEYEERRLAA